MKFNWESVFSNKGTNKQILVFNGTSLNIMTNFIPHEIKFFKNWVPPWINNKVKTTIQEKNKIYQLYLKNKSNMLATKRELLLKMI